MVWQFTELSKNIITDSLIFHRILQSILKREKIKQGAIQNQKYVN